MMQVPASVWQTSESTTVGNALAAGYSNGMSP